MRRLTFIAAGLAALLVTSIAVAHGIGGKSAKAVAATFQATGSSVSTKTCTTTDGKSITITNGRYTGTASGDPDLTGAITLSARSVINTTDNVGVVDGQLRIDVSGGHDTFAAYSAVYASGNVAGLASGLARNSGSRLVANLSAGFNPSSGFTGGKLGGGTSGGNAVEIGGAKCASTSSPKPEKSDARGTISALSANSITVAGLTCAISSSDSAAVNSKYKQGDRVQIHCTLQSGVNTLDHISGHGH
ncbi:MAG TPA: hypothetical protein VLV46_01980 [Gaiellaceae bacterium]|nr:hypothetical protein [Gaiellaceae bacterium]